MQLSVIIPIYNEVRTLDEIIRRVRATNLAEEIILVDDFSKDGTRDLLESYRNQEGIKIILHEENRGKGAAVRSGIQAARGEILLIQDADLEYDPRDYPQLLRPIQEGLADVVYGSRFLGASHRVTMFWHMLANQLLTLATNLLFNTILSDMETGYKLFRRKVVEGLTLRANRFDFEPEFTAKVLKRHYRIYEVPISFNPREYSEGKKIRLRDAFAAIWALCWYRLCD